MWVCRLVRTASLCLLAACGGDKVARPEVDATVGVSALQRVKNRISLLVDSSQSMLLTPQWVTFPETCLAVNWNGCTASGSPTVAQQQCNACMAWTIRTSPTCATSYTATCRSTYASCWRTFNGGSAPACGQLLQITSGVSTRGDGSALTPGCDVNGDGQANDSRMFQAKEAIKTVVATYGELEVSLWRYAQLEGGQTCSSDAECPDTPGGQSALTCEDIAGNRHCALDASVLGSATGQCAPLTWNGADGSFACSACSDIDGERLACEAFAMDSIRTGGSSPLVGIVNCALPATDHPFMMNHGALSSNGTCDPSGADRSVDFPATELDDNYTEIYAWLDHQQPNLATDVEINAHGSRPLAASLRDVRTAVFDSARLDTRTPCRKHYVVVVTDGVDNCESTAAAVSAAGTFQNMSFTNAGGVVVTDYDVPVYVVGFSVCPPSAPNCQARTDLDSVAAAGGTGSAILVADTLQLQLALAQIAANAVAGERCNGTDDDCDGSVDEDFLGKGMPCSAGIGACAASGQLACTADQRALQCNAVPGAPSVEVCNQRDDNCDGLIDNGVNCQGCVPVCNDAAQCDICNAVDEDCDGQLDEDFTPTSCGSSTGACESSVTTCVAGQVTCSGAIGPTPETCNNIDDNCDTIVDGFSELCYPAATTGCDLTTKTCTGRCRFGTATCTAGTFGTCTGAVVPAAIDVACNAVDDDCDGIVDEGKGPEQCNGRDDDCDGNVDELVEASDPDIGAPCGTPPFIGACRQGAIACVLGVEQCVGEVDPATDEVCDAIDNDCDGTTDEQVPGFGGACGSDIGRCELGTLQCVAGSAACVGGVAPVAEVCNDIDDDCDGVVDEADPLLASACATLSDGATVPSEVGACSFGVYACKDGAIICVGAIGPSVERCNGIDDDCDGSSDEDAGCADPCADIACVPGETCDPAQGRCVATASDGGCGCRSSDGAASWWLLALIAWPLRRRRAIRVTSRYAVGLGIFAAVLGAACSGDDSHAGPDACRFAAETCNATDDDCDGKTDEGIDLATDPANCGSCGNACDPDTETCAAGICCPVGFIDLDPDVPGCETACTDGCNTTCIVTGTETCDGVDNDCDTKIDEGFDTTTDPTNCGACGQLCHFANAAASCVNGTCVLGPCAPSFYDRNGQPGDGCEYGCIPSNGGVEICDGLDNDCDGTPDDGNPGGNVSCGNSMGACMQGLTACANGRLDCVGGIAPTTESCNNLDDDCDGTADNGFDKLTDPRYCANCAGCDLPHAVPGCSGGSCTVAGCVAGWVDLNGEVADGCEYPCTDTGAEVCDGVDNNCDGRVDQQDPSSVVPGNFCNTAGECAGTTPTCAGADGWVCIYTDPDVEIVDGNLALEETRCDGKDNDCDGAEDDVYPLKDSACAEDGFFGTTRRLGVCRGTGTLVCNAAMDGLRCNVTSPGATPTNETCNHLDDDCDGHVDEPYDSGAFSGVRDVVVGPVVIGGQSIVMYRYEASRPDATSASAGWVETRACSLPSRLPWAGGDFNKARAACQAAGMRLCRVTRDGSGQVLSDEWGRFCEGAANNRFPYGNTFDPTACNGAEYDPVPGGVNEDTAIPTGSLATCQAQDLARDMSGNLKEWVDDPRVVSSQTVHTLRGGSFDNFEHASTCDFDATIVPTTYTSEHTGFRCCARACPAGQIECGGTCVNPATNSNACGACGRSCAAGTACSNGYCCAVGTRACGDTCVPNAVPCP